MTVCVWLQMVAVVVDGERAVQQDDGRVVGAGRELCARLAALTTQEQQLAHLSALAPDPSIPITFTKVHKALFICILRTCLMSLPVKQE